MADVSSKNKLELYTITYHWSIDMSVYSILSGDIYCYQLYHAIMDDNFDNVKLLVEHGDEVLLDFIIMARDGKQYEIMNYLIQQDLSHWYDNPYPDCFQDQENRDPFYMISEFVNPLVESL